MYLKKKVTITFKLEKHSSVTFNFEIIGRFVDSHALGLEKHIYIKKTLF